jgi:hypothetical protein
MTTTTDRDVLDELLLPTATARSMERAMKAMGMMPGDVSRCISLAHDLSRQCLTFSPAFGTRLTRLDGRGEGVVVGVKPSGYREPLTGARRTANARIDADLAERLFSTGTLVWTVDPSAANPGIAQSPLDDWKQG